MVLDITKLPKRTTREKAFCNRGSILYGTLLTRGVNNYNPDWVLSEHPDIDEVFTHKHNHNFLDLQYPTNLIPDFNWFGDDNDCLAFLSYSISRPYTFSKTKMRDKYSGIIKYMLSNYLQLGGRLNFRSFNKYYFTNKLKFLPWTIEKNCLRFHVFPLTVRNIRKGMFQIKEVERIIGEILPEICELIPDIYRLIRIDEVSDQSSTFNDLHFTIEERIYNILRPYSGILSFLYKDMRGNQNAVRYTPSMLDK